MTRPADLTLPDAEPSESMAVGLPRLEHERKLIDDGRADFAAGRYVEGEDVERWLREEVGPSFDRVEGDRSGVVAVASVFDEIRVRHARTSGRR